MSEQNAINPTIRQKLSRLQTLLRGRLLLEGLGWVILAFCVALLATFSLDYLLRLEEVPLRLMVMLVATGGVMAVLIRTVLLPQLVTMDTDNLALLIERRYGVLSDRLISALQLARRTDHEKVGTSRAMIRRVGEELDGMIEKVRFEDVVETDRLRRVVIAALFLAAAVFTLVIYNSNLFSIWYQRNILLSETAFYPQRTYLVVQGGPDFQVHDGEDKQVLVRVSKDSTFTPPEITLHRVYNPGEDPVKTIVPYRPKKEDDPNSGAYVIEFKNVSSPFKFYVTGGDDTQDRRKPHHVTILETIKLDGDLALDVYFPGYQNRRPPEMTLHPGNEEKLAIPAGSTVVVRGVTTKPFKEASLYLNGWVIAKDQTTPESQSGTQDLKFQLQMDRRNKPGHESFLSDLVLSPGGSDFCSAVAAAVRAPATAAATGSRTFGKKHKLIVWAKDMTGFPRELRGHDLQMELDAEPSFSEFRPAFEIATVGDSVTNLVQVPFLIKVEDDYGLTDLQLEYRRDKEPWQLYKIDGRGPIRQAEHEETLIADVAKAHPALKPGETISFRAVAKDSLPRPYGGPNKQASNRVTFSIVDKDVLREDLGRRITQKADVFKPSIDNQQAAINKLIESHQEIRRGNDISAQVRQQLADTARMQKSIHTNAQNFADSLEAIVSHMERNRIVNELVREFKSDVLIPLREDVGSEDEDEETVGEIEEIHLALSKETVMIDDPREMAELLENLQRRQQRLKDRFDDYYKKAMKFASLQKLISKFGNVRDAAKELEEIIRKYGESGVKDILGG